MRLSLIEVGCDRDELNEPLGLASVSAAVRSQNPGCAIDHAWLKIEDPPERESLLAADLIGCSLQIRSLPKFRDLYRSLENGHRRPTLVVGNLIPTYAAEDVLREFPDVICVQSEGEAALSALCEIIAASGNVSREALASVPNLVYVAGGERVETPRRPVSLHASPPSDRRFLAAIRDRGGIARVEASRGCHWGRCEFCSVAERFGRGVWRPFPIGWVVRELEALSAAGVRSPYFSDEDFFGRDYARASSLAAAILEAKHAGRIDAAMNFFISMLAADIKVPACQDALRHLHRAGLREVFIGIESGVDVQLERYAKKARKTTNSIAIATAIRMGFQLDVGCIMFEPFMTLDELKLNIEYMRQLALPECDSRVVKALRVQPLTGMVRSAASAITGALDTDNLSYPYRFQDARVEEILTRFRDWARPLTRLVDRVMAAGRGEVESEVRRLEIKRLLSQVRELDLAAVSILVDVVEIGKPDDRNLESLAYRKEHLLTNGYPTMAAVA